MKRTVYKMLSIIMVCSLCVSNWCFWGTSVVVAEENVEKQDTYAIVLRLEGQAVAEIPSLNAGESLQMEAALQTEEGEDVSDVTFAYASSDEEVFTVSDDGILTAKSLSETATAQLTVRVLCPEEFVSVEEKVYTITVNPVEPQAVRLELECKTLVVKDVYTLDCKVEPETASQALVYTSSNETVATVDEKGNVTAKGEGTAIVTVAAKGHEEVCDTITIEVIDIPVSLELADTSYSLMATENFALTAQAVYASGKKEPVSKEELSYLSEDTTVLQVDGNGVVTALEQSSYPKLASVQVKYGFSYTLDGVEQTGEITASCQVTVTAIPVSGIELQNAEKKVTLEIGDTYTLLPNILPENATNQAVSYKSSKTSVATVNSKGVITAKSIGECTITVTANENSNVKTTFKVKVYQTVFNVAKLGANGKDTKADTSVFNKVLKYATLIDEPITVVVPNGTYYIDKTLTIYSDTNLCLAEKAVIKRKTSASGSAMLRSVINKKVKGYKQCQNITITGGTWNGNTDGKHDANCIYIGHAQNVVISDTTIKNNSGAHLIELAGVKNAVIENVELYGYKKCTEKGYTSSQADKEAIQLDYCSSMSTPAMKPHDGTACQNITIRNCNIHDYMSGIGTHTAMAKVYSKNIYIENNKFTNITNACINLRNFKKVTIKSNKASGFTTFLYAGNSTGTVSDNSIKNKSFKKKTKSGLRAANGITISNGSSFKITKNKIQKASSNGICVWNKSTATISDNTIKSNKLYGVRTQGSKITLKTNTLSKNKKGYYDTYKDATIKSSDDIKAYYIDIEKEYVYTGKKIKPKIKFKNLKKKYYKVTYKNNKKVGTATVIVKGKGKVKGTLKKTFQIVKK